MLTSTVAQTALQACLDEHLGSNLAAAAAVSVCVSARVFAGPTYADPQPFTPEHEQVSCAQGIMGICKVVAY